MWILNALIHDTEATVDELEAVMRTLVPDFSPGWAAILFTTTDVQIQALERLGFAMTARTPG